MERGMKGKEEEEDDEEDTMDNGVLGHEDDDEEDTMDNGVLGHEDDDDDDEEETMDNGVLGHEDDEDDEDDTKDNGVLGHEDDDEDEGSSSRTDCVEEVKKGRGVKTTPGIIYLGHIPPRLRPKHLRNMLTPYGEIGRIFLQPEDGVVKKKRRKAGSRGSNFTEGWVEFPDKRIAKRVAAALHNTPMGNKKHHRFHSDLWSMKYLHRFHWTHLSERLVYEQTVLRQRLRTEVSQAKRETNFYLGNVDKSQSMEKRRRKRETQGDQLEEKSWDFTQRQTEEEIQQKKRNQEKARLIQNKSQSTKRNQDKARLIQEKSQSNVSLLAKIFNSSQKQD
ncbi:unnamed protein product [Lota lota]